MNVNIEAVIANDLVTSNNVRYTHEALSSMVEKITENPGRVLITIGVPTGLGVSLTDCVGTALTAKLETRDGREEVVVEAHGMDIATALLSSTKSVIIPCGRGVLSEQREVGTDYDLTSLNIVPAHDAAPQHLRLLKVVHGDKTFMGS